MEVVAAFFAACALAGMAAGCYDELRRISEWQHGRAERETEFLRKTRMEIEA